MVSSGPTAAYTELVQRHQNAAGSIHGSKPLYRQSDPVARALYDFTYQAIRGTYSPQPYRTSLEPDVSSDDSSGGPVSSSASSGISSSGAPSSGCSSAPGAAPDSGTSSSSGNGPSAVNVPQTGDSAPLFLLSLAAILCAGMLILLLLLKRRAPNEKKVAILVHLASIAILLIKYSFPDFSNKA